MSINNNIYKEASDIITQRRLDAEQSLEARQRIAENAAPEIAIINTQLAQTGVKLFEMLSNGEDIKLQIARLEEENLQAQQMLKKILAAKGFREDYLEIEYTCKKCSDTGFYQSKRCDCFYELVSKLSAKHLNSTSMLKLCSFDTFDLDYYKGLKTPDGVDVFERMKSIFEYCKNYAENFSPDSCGIFMLGQTGLGKTHLSLAIAEKVISKGYSVAYDSIINFLMQVERDHFRRSDTDTLPMLLEVDLLILDDLGSEYDNNSFYSSTIYNIINTRLNKGLPTIISTNLNPTQLQKRYDDRIISRLFSMFDYLRFFGEDIRQKRRLQGKR